MATARCGRARRRLEDSDVVAAAVGSAPDLLDAVERLPPAAVLTDIRMPASQRGLPEQLRPAGA
jgi:CheY-like chemotaxis protein